MPSNSLSWVASRFRSSTSPFVVPTSIMSPTENALVNVRRAAPERHKISSLVATTIATATAVRDRAKVRSCGAQIMIKPTTATRMRTLRTFAVHRRATFSVISSRLSKARPAIMREARRPKSRQADASTSELKNVEGNSKLICFHPLREAAFYRGTRELLNAVWLGNEDGPGYWAMIIG